MAVKNKVQLITYPDSLGGNLKTLNHVINNQFKDVFKGGVHILPPFPSSGDRGFAPLTYFEIEPEFGCWEDIKTIGQTHDILVDVMVNHISRQSEYFQDFLKKGRKSPYADYFLTLDKIWPDGKPVTEDIEKMFRRRALPYSSFVIEETGEEETVWTTFGKTDPSQQIDLDINSEKVRQLFTEIFKNFKAQQIKIVRLDAVGYIIKKLGTSCFFVEPEIYEFLDWIMKLAQSLDIELLPEVHAHHRTQYKLAAYGCFIYDFILPYLILETIINKSSVDLCKYLKTRPHKQFTMLDCHDGIPVKPDLDGLIDTNKARDLIRICEERGARLSRVISDDHKDEDGFDIHQIACSFYSMLNADDDAYIAARAIQLFTPGIPQIYYVGLLAGENDIEAANQTGDPRAINRHNFTMDEIEAALEKEVVLRLIKLIKFRNEYEAFDGKFKVLDGPRHKVQLSWVKKDKHCTLFIDLLTNQAVIDYMSECGEHVKYNL